LVLVDTSVLIGFLKGKSSDKVKLFKEILLRNIPFGISPLTLQEVLQGARMENDFYTLKQFLSSQRIYYLDNEAETYEKAARIYFELRRRGVTPRSTIDILIALTAIENKLFLLHDDRDFEKMADQLTELKVLHRLV